MHCGTDSNQFLASECRLAYTTFQEGAGSGDGDDGPGCVGLLAAWGSDSATWQALFMASAEVVALVRWPPMCPSTDGKSRQRTRIEAEVIELMSTAAESS